MIIYDLWASVKGCTAAKFLLGDEPSRLVITPPSQDQAQVIIATPGTTEPAAGIWVTMITISAF